MTNEGGINNSNCEIKQTTLIMHMNLTIFVLGIKRGGISLQVKVKMRSKLKCGNPLSKWLDHQCILCRNYPFIGKRETVHQSKQDIGYEPFKAIRHYMTLRLSLAFVSGEATFVNCKYIQWQKISASWAPN